MILSNLQKLKPCLVQYKTLTKFFYNFISISSNRFNNISNIVDTKYDEIKNELIVAEDFLTIEEEDYLFKEIEPYIKRLRYQFEHFDNVISGYRESERTQWNVENKKVLNRVKQFAFDSFNKDALADINNEAEHSNLLSHVHILDLHKDGYIDPHVDAVRFCGNTIAGLSLLSDSVMHLTHVKDKNKEAFVLLKRRSLYIMRNDIRYNYKHAILKNSESNFKNQHIERNRRISVICRNRPDPKILEENITEN